MSRALQARNHLGSVKRWQAGDPAAVAEAERELAAAKLTDHAERIAADAPPLTTAQIDTIVAILRGNGRG